MKINSAAIAKAILILVFLTILPIVGQTYLPLELQRFLLSQSGINILGIIYNIAAIGVVVAVFILIRGHLEKASFSYLLVASAWKFLLLFIVLFILGVGHPETFGLTVIGGKAEAAENIVTFDFRIFSVFATIIVLLMIIRSILQYQEAKLSVR
jgi:hypothetical protein